jgi:acetyl-CoA carboxylase biotin carboxyl carrier protein
MDLNLIKKLIKLLETSDVTDLEIEENGTRVKLAKKVRMMQALSIPQVQVANSANQQTAVSLSKTEDKKVVDEHAGLHEIKSPIVGTFYRSPGPGAPPFLNVGDRVKKGDTICIIEAMKLMNKINSEHNGEVMEILVQNEEAVEYDQVLALIKVNK